jgi:hypothetical protein
VKAATERPRCLTFAAVMARGLPEMAASSHDSRSSFTAAAAMPGYVYATDWEISRNIKNSSFFRDRARFFMSSE